MRIIHRAIHKGLHFLFSPFNFLYGLRHRLRPDVSTELNATVSHNKDQNFDFNRVSLKVWWRRETNKESRNTIIYRICSYSHVNISLSAPFVPQSALHTHTLTLTGLHLQAIHSLITIRAKVTINLKLWRHKDAYTYIHTHCFEYCQNIPPSTNC